LSFGYSESTGKGTPLSPHSAVDRSADWAETAAKLQSHGLSSVPYAGMEPYGPENCSDLAMSLISKETLITTDIQSLQL
jgi:hypothetical protein